MMFPELLEIDGLKIEAIRDSRAFFLETSSSTADISSTESSKENRGGVRSVRVRYTCSVCSFPCRTRAAFRKHMQHHKNTCKICNELFESSDKLERHMVIYHGEPKYSCQLCYYVTWNLPDMKDHFVVRHLDPFCNSCSICNRTFPTKYAIERHMCKQHSNLSVACTICKRIFNNLTKLKTHTRFVHLKSGYQCELCKHRLSTLASLETHIRRHKAKQITPNLDTYICTTCGETFFNKPTLNKHMAVHGKINPYICPVCQKAFEKRSNQVQHILTHMTNVYECDICGVKFSRRAHLIIHRKTHPGPLGPLPIIPVIGIVSEFVKDYINKTKNLQKID